MLLAACVPATAAVCLLTTLADKYWYKAPSIIRSLYAVGVLASTN